jgi:hypothetical protein
LATQRVQESTNYLFYSFLRVPSSSFVVSFFETPIEKVHCRGSNEVLLPGKLTAKKQSSQRYSFLSSRTSRLRG